MPAPPGGRPTGEAGADAPSAGPEGPADGRRARVPAAPGPLPFRPDTKGSGVGRSSTEVIQATGVPWEETERKCRPGKGSPSWAGRDSGSEAVILTPGGRPSGK